MEVILRKFDLKLQHTFTISRNSYDTQPTLIVELKEGAFSGYGEATSNPYYGITVPKMIDDIHTVLPIIESVNNQTPEEFWKLLQPHFKDNMFALCALDMAYNDLYARKKGMKLFELWNYRITENPLSNFTIGIDSVDNMIAKMQETPWPIYKIKLGTKDDLKIIKALRRHSDSVFRIDANGAWSVDETLKNAIALKTLGVEFLEQPVSAEDTKGIQYVYENSVLPIIADESCQVESDIEACFQHFHGVNIKLVKCGGLTPARRMIKRAKELQMQTMVGCMTESSIGISAIAHLLPSLDYVDMDGAMLLRKDIASGVTIEKGQVLFAAKNGTGVTLTDFNPIITIR